MLPRTWTREEDDILARVYPERGWVGSVAALGGKRTKAAVIQRAGQRGLKMTAAARGTVLAGRSKQKPIEPEPEQKPHLKAGPHGVLYDPSKTAGGKEGLEKVPEAAIGLPWVSYPKDPATANLVASMLESAADSLAVKKAGPEARAFFESHARYLRAIAIRKLEAA